jgi:prophage tail gpP-like protein
MSLKIRLNGQTFTDFISAQVLMSIETAASSFAFTSSAQIDNLFPIKEGDLVEILADDKLISTGHVEDVGVTYDAQSHTIEVKGRSLLADLIDSTVGSIKEFTGQVNLVDVARAVLDGLGLTSIKIINKAGTIKNFNAEDITSAETGKNAFEFVELYARKRQVLITTDGDGNMVLVKGSGVASVNRFKNIQVANDNNVLSARLTSSNASLFNQYIAQSQLNPVNLDEGVTTESVSGQVGVATDSSIRTTRTLEFNSEESSDSVTLNDRAAWESNIRRARAKNYIAVVQGHSASDEAWEPNKLYKVDDDFCGVHGTLLSREVAYRYDLQNGSTTEINMTNRKAYTLQAEEDAREANTNEFGNDF